MLTPPVADPPAPVDLVEDGPPGSRRRLLWVLVVASLVAGGALVFDAARPDGPPESPPGAWTLLPHAGVGAWVDAYDWTVELGGTTPAVDVDDIDEMAEAGVQTLYLQTSHRRSASVVMEQERLEELIDRAHEREMHVVAWYLPTLVDTTADLARLTAAAELRVDGLAVDIEATDVVDPADRNARLLDLSDRLRTALGEDKVIAGITLSTVHTQVVNPDFWPGYPYAELAQRYDVLMPMAYWTLRVGELREPTRYIGENVDRLRAIVGPDLPIHVIGGIADAATEPDVRDMVQALEDRKVIGASLYDWATSRPEQWTALRPLRVLRAVPFLLVP